MNYEKNLILVRLYYVFIVLYFVLYIYIYIYIYREREREISKMVSCLVSTFYSVSNFFKLVLFLLQKVCFNPCNNTDVLITYPRLLLT